MKLRNVHVRNCCKDIQSCNCRKSLVNYIRLVSLISYVTISDEFSCCKKFSHVIVSDWFDRLDNFIVTTRTVNTFVYIFL